MSIEGKINLLTSKKLSTLLTNYKIKISEIKELINNIEKNENLKIKYQNEITTIKKQLTKYKKIEKNIFLTEENTNHNPITQQTSNDISLIIEKTIMKLKHVKY